MIRATWLYNFFLCFADRAS